MRIALEAILSVVALYLAYYIINLNEQYADMVESVKFCDIQFNDSVATAPCKINDNVAEVRM